MPSPEQRRLVGLKQAGLLTAVPFALLVGPALGYYLGIAFDQRWTASPWGMIVGIFVGLLAGARLTIQFIQQAQALDKQ